MSTERPDYGDSLGWSEQSGDQACWSPVGHRPQRSLQRDESQHQFNSTQSPNISGRRLSTTSFDADETELFLLIISMFTHADLS